MARLSVAALLVIVALGVTPSSALRCWVCNSDNDRGCGDPFQKYEENFYLECNLPAPKAGDFAAHRPVCVKTTRRIDSYRTFVQRSCEWGHVSNLQASACSAKDNNPYLQNSYGGGGYAQAQVGGGYSGSQNYPPPGGYGGSQPYPPPGGFQQQGTYRQGYQQPGYPQPGVYQQNYPNNYGSGNNYVSGYTGGGYGSSYGDYCVICTTDGCNSAPHSLVVTPLTALAALLAPVATWFFARR